MSGARLRRREQTCHNREQSPSMKVTARRCCSKLLTARPWITRSQTLFFVQGVHLLRRDDLQTADDHRDRPFAVAGWSVLYLLHELLRACRCHCQSQSQDRLFKTNDQT